MTEEVIRTRKKPARATKQREVDAIARRLRVAARVATYLALTGLATVFVFPLLFTLSNALKSDEQIFALPPVWIPKPIVFRYIAMGWTLLPFTRYTINTLFVTITALVGHVLSSAFVAFGFTRLRGPGRDKLFALVLATMMLPRQVTMIPTYLLMRYLGWVDTYFPLIVPAYLGGAPFFIFLVRQFMLGISRELDDAARIDGCGSWDIFWKVILPLLKPALGAVAIFAFVGNWNDFLGPLIYLNSAHKLTLSVGLRLYQITVIELGLVKVEGGLQSLLGISLIVLLPVVVIFFSAQKQFIQGITFTGIKG